MSQAGIRADLTALQTLKVNVFPHKWIRKHSYMSPWTKRREHYTSEITFSSNQDIEKLKTHYEMELKGFHQCFFCNRWSKEDKGGIYRPMDKRESGDNGWGDTYSCFKCVPKEFGRL